MKRKGLILAVLAAIVAAVMGLAACNGNGDTAPVRYTVSFVTNGGSTVAPMTVDEGSSVNLPEPKKTDFTFDGWFANEDLSGSKLSSPYTPTADATLYAKWAAIVYTAEEHFTFEEIKDSNDKLIGYSVSLVSGTVPSNIYVPISHNEKPVLTVKSFANESVNKIAIFDSVTEIESGAFSGCGNLTSVTIGSGVKSIGDSAFSGCYRLIEVYNLSSLDITAGADTHGYVARYAKNVYTSSSIASKITTKDGYMFYNDNDSYYLVGYNGTDTVLTLPNDYNEKEYAIYDRAFYNCSNLTSVTIGSGVKTIGSSAFANSGLTSITIPDSVTIGSSAFENCYKLIEVYNLSTTLDIKAGSTAHGYVAQYAKNVYTSKSGASKITTADGYIFYNDNDSYYLVGYNGTDTVLTLPNDHNGKNYSIYNYAFYNYRNLTSVTIGSGVTSIGNRAFENCSSLTSVTIGSGVIGDYAFANSGLTSVTIDSGVTSIGSRAFENCSGLTSITIPGSVTSIGIRAFNGCSGLTNVTIDSGVTSISSYAFRDCSNLTSITIPDTVTSIGNRAFENCSKLTSVTIPNSVTSIDDGAYYGCRSLTSVTIPNSVTTIGGSAFYGCSGLTSVTIPNSVTSIGESAFQGCNSLTSIIIPDSVTSIGESAFENCSGLTSVTIGSGIESIGNRAFLNCSGATSITIGSGITSIGDYAFYTCSKLTSITIPDTVTSIGINAFEYCYKLIEVNNLSSLDITAGSTTHGYVAYYAKNVYTSTSGESKVTTADGYIFYNDNDSYYLVGYNGTDTVLTLPNDHNGKNYSIYNYAFYNYRNLTSIIIPDSVTSIGSSAFENCSGLTSVTIGSGVTSIGNRAFNGCSKLTSITIPDSVTSIGISAFENCSGLTSVTIGSGVKSIGNRAFLNCSKLTSITIPDSVTSIGDSAFENCYKLIEVYNLSSLDITAGTDTHGYVARYAKNVYTSSSGESKITTKDGYMFYNDNGSYYLIGYNGTDTALTLPNDHNGKSYAIYERAFYGCSGLTSVTIGSGVESIGSSAFSGCNGLTSITIPDSVTTIGNYAFRNCSSLTSITFNGTKEQWTAISKNPGWAYQTPYFTVKCTDGTLNKSEDNA